MRAAVQFLRQPAETTHESLQGFADGSLRCQGASSFSALFICLRLHPSCRSSMRTGVLLTQFLGDQVTGLRRLPHSKSQFQFQVSVSAFGDLGQEQATTVAAEQGPGLVTAHGSFEAFCPSRRKPRDHTSRECPRRGLAELGEQLLVSISEDDVPDRAVRKRAVVPRFSWRCWLRALKQLFIHGRTSASCVLMPRLPTVLKRYRPHEGSWSGVLLLKKTALVASPRPYGTTDHTGLTVKMTQLPDALGEQSLPTMLLSHVQHEAVQREQLGLSRTVHIQGTSWAVVSAVAVSSTAGIGGAGEAMDAAGSPKFANSGLLSSRIPDCSGLNLQLR